ncbi:MAG TPA: MFS transporter [Acetobacteraceae bacterium]|nr:MFS transporter [Acetobacteraceae bacterium]
MTEPTAAQPGPLVELDNRALSPRQRYAAILVAFGEFIDGYDLIVMGAALILLRPQFHLSPAATGALGASTFLGAMLGLLAFGDMSDRWGRRAIFVANLLFFVVFSILSAFVQSVPQLFAARFLVGVGVGMDIPTSAAYLAEIAPRHRRGIIAGSLLNIMWILGAMVSNLIALPLLAWTGPAAWRWMFGLAAVPAALVLLGRQALPESPRWLLAHGRADTARQVLRGFGITADAATLSRLTSQPGSYAQLFRPPYRARVLLVALIFFLNCVAGPLSTIAVPFVLRTVGALSNETSLLFSTLVWCTSLLGVVLGLTLIDRIGRRSLLYIAVIPEALAALFMAFAGPGHPPMLVAGFFAFSFCSWLGPAVLTWVWSSELFPTRLRGRSQGFCNAACRLAISINIFLIPVGVAAVGFTASIVVLSVPLFMLALLVSRLPFLDSGGRSLEALAE